MSTHRVLLATLSVALVVAATAAWMPPSHLGPPWVSIEYPPSPYDQTTRGAYLLVHAYHHGTPVALPVRGTAEGIVGGERRTVRLEFGRTSRTGVYALRKQWSDEGTWMLAISVTQGEGDGNTVSALVDLGANGHVTAVRVPTQRRNGWDVPSAVTAADIDAALRARVGRELAADQKRGR